MRGLQSHGARRRVHKVTGFGFPDDFTSRVLRFSINKRQIAISGRNAQATNRTS